VAPTLHPGLGKTENRAGDGAVRPA